MYFSDFQTQYLFKPTTIQCKRNHHEKNHYSDANFARSELSVCAGQYGDELGRCLVKNASEADTKVLTQWAFVTLGQTKAAREIATISPQVTSRTTSKAQTVVLRLLGKDCAKEALKATLYEGKDGIGNGIKSAVTQRIQAELQTQTVDAIIEKMTSIKTP